MADGGELLAFLASAQEETAQAVEDIGRATGAHIDDTAQRVMDSLTASQGAEDANTRLSTGIRQEPQEAGSGGGAPGSGEPNRIARMLAGEPRHSAKFGHTDSFDYKKTFFDAHPGVKGKVVVHHAVEQQAARRYPGAGITPNEMHSLENLRGIPKGDNNSMHLSHLRKEWNRFYRNNPNATRQDLLEFATKLDVKYGSEFDPPVK